MSAFNKPEQCCSRTCLRSLIMAISSLDSCHSLPSGFSSMMFSHYLVESVPKKFHFVGHWTDKPFLISYTYNFIFSPQQGPPEGRNKVDLIKSRQYYRNMESRLSIQYSFLPTLQIYFYLDQTPKYKQYQVGIKVVSGGQG